MVKWIFTDVQLCCKLLLPSAHPVIIKSCHGIISCGILLFFFFFKQGLCRPTKKWCTVGLSSLSKVTAPSAVFSSLECFFLRHFYKSSIQLSNLKLPAEFHWVVHSFAVLVSENLQWMFIYQFTAESQKSSKIYFKSFECKTLDQKSLFCISKP